ncbi:hypothetical protein D3C87_1725210 [compost metagenome]
MHGRASIRNHQGVDGLNPFPDAPTEKRPNGDGATRAGLQHQTDDQYDWRKSAHQSHSRLKWRLNALLAPKAAKLNHRDYLRRLPASDRRKIEPIPPDQARLRIATGCAGVFTQPRPEADLSIFQILTVTSGFLKGVSLIKRTFAWIRMANGRSFT